MGMSYGEPSGAGRSSDTNAARTPERLARRATSDARARRASARSSSDKMQKTVVVAIERRVAHPVYGKMITRTTRLKAHDEQNASKAGDTVRIVETRPLSKDKRWRVVEILERAR